VRVKRRIARIKAKFGSKYTGFRQPGGSTKYIRHDRLPAVFADVANGRDTPAARAVLCAESATDGSSMHQLLQSLRRPPYVPANQREVIQ
jgi:hypothetical protein